MAAYPVPPEGFKTERANIPHGELKVVEYDSKTLGLRRLMRVYTPPIDMPAMARWARSEKTE